MIVALDPITFSTLAAEVDALEQARDVSIDPSPGWVLEELTDDAPELWQVWGRYMARAIAAAHEWRLLDAAHKAGQAAAIADLADSLTSDGTALVAGLRITRRQAARATLATAELEAMIERRMMRRLRTWPVCHVDSLREGAIPGILVETEPGVRLMVRGPYTATPPWRAPQAVVAAGLSDERYRLYRRARTAAREAVGRAVRR